MSDIIHTLYEATSPTRSSAAYQAAFTEVCPFYEKIRRAFSPDYLDGLLSAQAALTDIEGEEHFLRGLRLGAELMLTLYPRP